MYYTCLWKCERGIEWINEMYYTCLYMCVFVWERYRMYKWDRICTIHICIRVQVRERERESEIEIWQPEGMKILDRIFPIPAIKIKVKEKIKEKKSFCISSLKSKPSSH